MRNNLLLICLVSTISFLSSCGSQYETSSITGWDYNDPRNGGFEKRSFSEQETGPG